MSGHSKWHSIKHKKAAEDSKKGKVFTKHAKLVAIAARKGGDPEMNPSLRTAIDNARADNTPYDNIERAIKKGSGEGKDAVAISEVLYEGFAPGGVALLIESFTDNRNRTVSNLKLLLGKKGGTLGASGSVSYMFSRKGMLTVKLEGKNADEIELAAIDAGAEDVQKNEDDNIMEIYTAPQELNTVKTKLNESGVKTEKCVLTYVATTETEVDDEATAEKIMDLVELIEEDDDVSNVYTNMK